MKTKKPAKIQTPEVDPRFPLWLALGERQFLMTKLANEMSAIIAKLNELQQNQVPTK